MFRWTGPLLEWTVNGDDVFNVVFKARCVLVSKELA